MTDPRHQARKVALAALFSWSFGSDLEGTAESRAEILGIKNFKKSLAEGLTSGVKKNRAKIDNIIEETAPEFPLEEMAKVDLSILRIAIFELLWGKVPPKVAIDEAVELAKEFGSEASGKFVNGVLGTVVEKKEIVTESN